MGDVKGHAVRPHHGPDDIDGEISGQGSGREESRRQAIARVRQAAWPLANLASGLEAAASA
jgi:hypothetical protein